MIRVILILLSLILTVINAHPPFGQGVHPDKKKKETPSQAYGNKYKIWFEKAGCNIMGCKKRGLILPPRNGCFVINIESMPNKRYILCVK